MAEPDESSGRARLSSIRKRRRRARLLRWLVFLAAVGAAVFLWLQYGSIVFPPAPDRAAERAGSPEPVPPEPSVPAAPESEAPAPTPAPSEAPPALAPLPTLAESDAVLREEADALSDARAWRRWLASRDLLERFVLAVVQVSEGTSPRKPLAPLAPLAPAASYRVRSGADGRITPHPASHARYDEIARIIAALDAEECAALYRRFEPLVEEIHTQLGAPRNSFRDVLASGAAELLLAPRLVGEPELVFHVNHYRYADPALQGLSSAQKLVLRTGPANARSIQAKVREIALALGVPKRSLPETPLYRVAGG